MVHFGLTFPIHSVEAILLLVDSIGEAEEGVEGTLYHAHDLFFATVEFRPLVVASHWHKLSQLLSGHELLKSDSSVDLIVETNLI